MRRGRGVSEIGKSASRAEKREGERTNGTRKRKRKGLPGLEDKGRLVEYNPRKKKEKKKKRKEKERRLLLFVSEREIQREGE